MSYYRHHTGKEIETLEKDGMLWVCPSCDAHCDADWVGETCPNCKEKIQDEVYSSNSNNS
jgi:rubrerythrin